MSSPSRPRRRRAVAALTLALGVATVAAGCSSESATLTDVTLPSTTKAPATKAPGDPTGGGGKTTATTADPADPAGGGPAPKTNAPTKGGATSSPAAQAKRTPEEKAASCKALHDFQWAMLFIDIAIDGKKLRENLDSELDRTGQAFIAADKNWQPQIELITADLHQRLATHLAAIADLPKGENRATDQPADSPEVARARSELNFWRSVCPPVT